MRGLLADFLSDEAGATSAEYALIASGIAVAIVASLGAISTAVSQILVGFAN